MFPSTSEEARRAARVIPEQDALDAIGFMRDALVDAETGRQQNGGRPTVGAVLVDPLGGCGGRRGRVVATASRERQKVRHEEPASMRDHPLHHAVMLCVQGVGRALSAGSRQEKLARKQEEDSAEGKEREGKGSESLCSDEDPAGGVVEVLSPKQYLCTGFDLYVTREPCLM